MYRRLLFAALLVPSALTAQIAVTDSLNTTALSTLLEGFNITISNLVVTCPPDAHGEFDGTSSIPILHGLLMTSGKADLAAGPNDSAGETGMNSAPGDADLDALIVSTTFDACVLEFDCVPLGDTLLFNFAFASEEYLEWAGTAFNDVFAIWLTGPGFPIPTNVATIPGGTPVSINNVNNLVNPAYYIDNGDGFTPPMNTDPFYVQYDGFTQNLTVFAVVTPGATYHFKVAVADVGDGVLDSAVLLEAFSFRSVMGASSVVDHAADQLFVHVLNDLLEVTASAGYAGADGRIIDEVGRTVLRFTTDGPITSIPIGHLRTGSYLVEVTGPKGALRQRFFTH